MGPQQGQLALADELLRQAEQAEDPAPLIAAARTLLGMAAERCAKSG